MNNSNKKNSFYKPFLVLAIPIANLLDIHKNYINSFYEIIKDLSKKYTLIFLTSENKFLSKKFLNEIKINEGYLISNFGSYLYDIKNDNDMYISNILNNKVTRLYHDVIINVDSIVINGYRSIIYYSHYKDLIKKLNSEYFFLESKNVFNYEDGKKFIKKNKIEYLSIFLTSHDISIYKQRRNDLLNICKENNLFCWNYYDNQIIINDSNVNDLISKIFRTKKLTNNYSIIYFSDIFKQYNINAKKSITLNMFIEDLIKNRTFFLFNEEFKKVLKENNII